MQLLLKMEQHHCQQTAVMTEQINKLLVLQEQIPDQVAAFIRVDQTPRKPVIHAFIVISLVTFNVNVHSTSLRYTHPIIGLTVAR